MWIRNSKDHLSKRSIHKNAINSFKFFASLASRSISSRTRSVLGDYLSNVLEDSIRCIFHWPWLRLTVLRSDWRSILFTATLTCVKYTVDVFTAKLFYYKLVFYEIIIIFICVWNLKIKAVIFMSILINSLWSIL